MAERTFRIYWIEHDSGNVTGYLMRRTIGFFRPEPVVAFGPDTETVKELLAAELDARSDSLYVHDYLWSESFKTNRVKVEIRPATSIGSTWMVGSDTVPLRLTYAHSSIKGGGVRVMLPRFDWWIIVESLADAPDVLRQIISSSLMGESPKWAFDFREQTKEWTESAKFDYSDKEQVWSFDSAQTVLSTVENIAEDWVAHPKRLPKHVGEPDISMMTKLGSTQSPQSFVVVGESGVGKTARLYELAKRLAVKEKSGSVPHIWATDPDRIIAGMSYLGQWEQRCLDIVNELRHEGNWLYVGRLEDFIAERSGGASIADLFYPAIREGSVSIIAETTPESWTYCQREAPSLCAALSIVRVAPASPSDVPELIQAYVERRRTTWKLHPEATRRIVRFLTTFEPHTAFPGKAFRFLDWLIEERRSRSSEPSSELSPNEITKAFGKRTGLPETILSDDIKAGKELISEELACRVVGQPVACDSAATVIARLKSGMNDPEKPCGSLLFVGPTGVGKTQLAKEMARYVFGDPNRMIRLDMSEFQSARSVNRLIAFGRGVESLASRVSQNPLSIVLLDEIEKAHPAVFDLLLGVLGEGRLTDARGRHVDFRMTIIVLTSNVGAGKSSAVGFGESGQDSVGATRQFFRPEFFNRLDVVVPFTALTPADVSQIARLMVDGINRRDGMTKRNVEVVLDDAAFNVLSDMGWDEKNGARPLARVLEERIVTPVAVYLAKHPKATDITVNFSESLTPDFVKR